MNYHVDESINKLETKQKKETSKKNVKKIIRILAWKKIYLFVIFWKIRIYLMASGPIGTIANKEKKMDLFNIWEF